MRSQGRLIAFAQNLIFGKTEVNYSVLKFDPEFLKLYPSYALIHTMNRHYLQEEGFEYVNDGYRSILHDTNVQEFLIEKFGFEKAYTNLHLHYRQALRILMLASYPFRRSLSCLDRRLQAMYRLEECRRTRVQFQT